MVVMLASMKCLVGWVTCLMGSRMVSMSLCHSLFRFRSQSRMSMAGQGSNIRQAMVHKVAMAAMVRADTTEYQFQKMNKLISMANLCHFSTSKASIKTSNTVNNKLATPCKPLAKVYNKIWREWV